MKIILFFIFLSLFNCYSLEIQEKNINIYGETNISYGNGSEFESNLYAEYNLSIYEPPHEKWGLFIAGKVNPAYDHLGNEIKMDVFTVFGIDF